MLVVEAYESVARTPELLPVLKENGVVDSTRVRANEVVVPVRDKYCHYVEMSRDLHFAG